jgi:hypothetical protein
MDLLRSLIDLILHVDRHLIELLAQYHLWIYAILFLIIFAETGFVVTPFLPGDSLLFATGALTAVDSSGTLQLPWILLLLITAAILGNCQLSDRPQARRCSLQWPLPLSQAGIPATHEHILRATWRYGSGAVTLCSYHSYLRSICSGRRAHELVALPELQFRWRNRMGGFDDSDGLSVWQFVSGKK